jgi:hypothetical protein
MLEELADPAGDNTNVRRDTAQIQDGEHGPDATDFEYTPEERTAIDAANEAFGLVIQAVNTFGNMEAWVPTLVRGVRAFRAPTEPTMPIRIRSGLIVSARFLIGFAVAGCLHLRVKAEGGWK